MKGSFLCALSAALCLAVFATAARPTFEFSPVAQFSSLYSMEYSVMVAAQKDLLAFTDISGGSERVYVHRRNSEGRYELNATIFANTAGIFVQTNGFWLATFDDDSAGILFNSVGEGGQISGTSILFTAGGQLLSDDTFVAMDQTGNGDNTYTIHTYEFIPAMNQWKPIEGADLVVTTTAQYVGYISTYRASDTHLVVNDFSSNESYAIISIYERQPNKSWTFQESFTANASFPSDYAGSVTYNGVDTVVIAYPFAVQDADYFGMVQIFTKINGEWIQQDYDEGGLGYDPSTIFGVSVLFVNADVLLLSASLEGNPDGLQNGGKVLMLTRDANGLWQDSFDLIGDSGLFGMGLAVNDHDILVSEITSIGKPLNVTVLSAPICFYEPINVTCNNVQTTDCPNIDVSSLYTINNPKCGDVNVTLENLKNVTGSMSSIEATFSFTRSFVNDTMCTATITCLAPPTVTSGPVANAGPKPAGTSSAVLNHLAAVNVLVMALIALLM